jgi:hypothetical protein
LKVHGNFYKQESPDYKQIFKAPPFNWCSIVGSRKSKGNALIKLFLEPIRGKYPSLFQCPMKGALQVMNVSTEAKLLNMFPSGIYKIVFTAENKNDQEIAFVSILLKI